MKRDVNALIGYLAERATMPYEWGRNANDCVSFAAGAVKAATGKDPARGLKWKSQATALSLLNKLGGVEAVLDERFERIAPAFAHRGDIAIAAPGSSRDGLDAYPLIVEGNWLCSPGERGLKRLPRSAMVAAWDITKPKKKPRE